jgi:hypothetical protein
VYHPINGFPHSLWKTLWKTAFMCPEITVNQPLSAVCTVFRQPVKANIFNHLENRSKVERIQVQIVEPRAVACYILSSAKRPIFAELQAFLTK